MSFIENNILYGPKEDYFQESLGKLLFLRLQNGGSKVAMVETDTGTKITYQEILQRSVSLAQYLNKFGLKDSDCISISGENCINFTISAISALFLGVKVVPLNHSYNPREFVHALNISMPKLIFCASNILDKILESCKQVEFVQKIIVIDSNSQINLKNISLLEEYLHLPLPNNFNIANVSLDHVQAILCSSGTTGHPKGVMLTNRNLNAAINTLIHKDFQIINSNKIALALLPFYHGYGFTTHLAKIIGNMTMIIVKKFEEKAFLATIEKYRITTLFLVPPILVFLSKSPLIDNYNISCVQDVLCGAAPLSKEIQESVIKRLNIANIRQAYGLTEATLAATLTPININNHRSVGALLPGFKAKIIDIKTNKALGPDIPGEICLKGPQLMKGYCGNVEATRATIDKDGWLHTGDVGYYDIKGYFYIVDRYKELIKYKGYQVPPAEIEAILLKNSQIRDCAVIGKPDELAGELPVAFVVKQPGSKITEKEIQNYVADNVSYQKRLHGGVIFVDSIPKNPTGKILRRILRDQLKKPNSKL